MAGRFCWVIFVLAGALQAQKFEVASVKVMPAPGAMTDAERARCGTKIDAAQVQFRCVTPTALITRAYEIEPFQLSGPDWMPTQRLEVIATLPEGSTAKDIPAMLRDLLAERFQLKVRRETREEQVYALVVGKDGAKLKDAPAGDLTSTRPFPNGPGDRILLSISNHEEDGWQTYSLKSADHIVVFEAPRITMAWLAKVLMTQVELPVVDQTGLKGAYEVVMPVPGGPNMGRPALRDTAVSTDQAAMPSGVSIFKSLEKLGLGLEKRKAPIEHMIVEQMEKRPSEN